MVNEQVKKFETAARIYCDMNGMHPDQTMRIPHPIVAGTVLEIPFWHTIAERMIDLSQLLVAMRRAGEKQVVIAPPAALPVPGANDA